MASAASPSPSAAFSPFRSPSSTSASVHSASLATCAALPGPKELRGWRNRVVVSTTKDLGKFRGGKQGGTRMAASVYHTVEIECSKFGVKDFDFGYAVCRSPPLGLTPFFGFYNKTTCSGLTTYVLNSYTNPILQVMHDTLLVGKLVRLHIATNCTRAHCLSASSVSYYARRCTRDQLLIQQLLQDARSCSR